MRLRYAFALLLFPLAAFAQTTPPADGSWHFVVAGDSRNCGDVVMPAIAQGAASNRAAFYWHLGDFRAIYMFDQDYQVVHKSADPKAPMNIAAYLANAWQDFIENQ